MHKASDFIPITAEGGRWKRGKEGWKEGGREGEREEDREKEGERKDGGRGINRKDESGYHRSGCSPFCTAPQVYGLQIHIPSYGFPHIAGLKFCCTRSQSVFSETYSKSTQSVLAKEKKKKRKSLS